MCPHLFEKAVRGWVPLAFWRVWKTPYICTLWRPTEVWEGTNAAFQLRDNSLLSPGAWRDCWTCHPCLSLQFIRAVTLLQHETKERRETTNECNCDWEGGYIYVLGKKACTVYDLGMLEILLSLSLGILPMQHIKELASSPTSLLLESLFNLAGVGSHASTLNLSSMQEVLLLCHSFRSCMSTLCE